MRQAVGVGQCIVNRGLFWGQTRTFLARNMTGEQLMATVEALNRISLHFGREILSQLVSSSMGATGL